MTDQPRCHCGSSDIVIRYRLLPRTDRAPLSEAGRRAQGGAYWEHACARKDHQRQVREAGSVLAVEPIGDDAVTRMVRG